MKTIANVKVGEPDVEMSAPSHIQGVGEGNTPKGNPQSRGIVGDGLQAKASVSRSTGINPESRQPIDPKMPKLSPA